MATLGANVVTLLDHAKRMEPNGGSISSIVELLGQTNEMLEDMHWKQGNLETGNRTTVRTGLPTVAWRQLNQGVQPSKSLTAQVDEDCGILEAWSEIDKDVAELNGNTADFRMSEAMAFIEAMNIEMQSTIFYGNSDIDPEEFLGLSARYSSTTAANGRNIVLGGGAGSDNSSIWLCVWGPNTMMGIYPKGSKLGLQHEDKGLQVIQTSTSIAGTRLDAYVDKWQWKCGLSVRDWRYASRAPNIDISALTTETSAADLSKIMIKMTHRIQSLKAGRAAFYVNRTIIEMLDIQRLDGVKAGGGISWQSVDGQVIYNFRGIPIRLCDALLENESLVS